VTEEVRSSSIYWTILSITHVDISD